MRPASRFDDRALHLWTLADVILVRCPQCGRRARVERAGERFAAPARLTCAHCGLAREQEKAREGWSGPVMISAQRGCPVCGRPLRMSPRHRPAPPPEGEVRLTCRGCGATCTAPLRWSPLAFDRPVDFYFGLPLWLQAPCRGETLWAYNERHLQFLRGYVGAGLRERVPHANRSLAARLPKWIKTAHAREDVLRCIEKLEETLR